jgi:hypothetical protein
MTQGPPTEELHDTYPGPLGPQPCEPQEGLHFFPHRLRSHLDQCAAFGFHRGNALGQRLDVLPRLGETVAETRRERGTIPQAEGRQLLREGPAGGQH